jgi:hypothetical protein
MLFDGQICSLHEFIIDMSVGLTLYKTLQPNHSLQNIDLVLETIDDLYVLLDGLVPNIEKMIIQLRQSRILCKYSTQNIPIDISSIENLKPIESDLPLKIRC